MVYLLAAFVGVVVAVVSLILFVTAASAKFRRQEHPPAVVGIRITSPLPLAIAISAFSAGFYLVLRISG